MRDLLRLFWAAIVSSAVLAPASAGAMLDPSRAQVDVDSAIHEEGYTFCRAPREPLSSEDVALCPHASATPDCDGFAAACAKLAEQKAVPWTPPPPPPISFGFLAAMVQALVWLLVMVVVLAVLVPMIRGLMRARKDPKVAEPEHPRPPAPHEPPAEAPSIITDEELLLRRGEQLSREGRHTEAVQLYLAASLRALDKRGALLVARDRTNGEYVRACKDTGAKPALREIVREVDRAQFGGVPPTEASTSIVREQALAIVRAAPAVMLTILVVAAGLGCGVRDLGGKGRSGAGHPAGDELFHELLRRQGVHLEPLDRSLATLDVPKPGERGPAVLVDVEKTPLDDETAQHVERWVDSGGMLVLFGDPEAWPTAFGNAKPSNAADELIVNARKLLARTSYSPAADAEDDGTSAASPQRGPHLDDDEQDDDSGAAQDGGPVYAERVERAALARRQALEVADPKQTVAWFESGPVYAAVVAVGQGYVLEVASDELLTNAALSRPGNAAALVAILSNADRTGMRLAQPDDGVSPPSTPIAAVTRAGLGPGLVQGLFAALVLFLAVGLRLARPRPTALPTRRAFAEHVEAVGALYARTRSAPHALAAYARFADERIRARMPRGATDVPAFLAARTKLPLESCQHVWSRAMDARAGTPPLGDELAVLKELSAVYAATIARD